jgi:hypothetical protein
MPLDTATKIQLAQFGRTIALLFNRSMMYQPNHPFVEQSIEMFYKGALDLLNIISPLVFILNREEFFVDEEPLDARINVGRLVMLFKKNGIQSISIEPGLEKREIKVFLEVFANITKYDGAEGFRKAIFARGVSSIKVNHVRYKKVTEDDEVITRDALKDLTPQMLAAEDEAKTRKMFMDTLLESVLTEEFAKTLNIESLMANPGAVSQNMIQADLESVSAKGTISAKGSGSGGRGGTGDGPGGSGEAAGAGDGSNGPGGNGLGPAVRTARVLERGMVLDTVAVVAPKRARHAGEGVSRSGYRRWGYRHRPRRGWIGDRRPRQPAVSAAGSDAHRSGQAFRRQGRGGHCRSGRRRLRYEKTAVGRHRSPKGPGRRL